MSRVPPIPPADLTDDQRPHHDAITKLGHAAFKDKFVWKNSEDALLGPFPVALHQPSIARVSVEYVAVLGTLPGLPPTAREVAILTVAYHWSESSYATYSHGGVALSDTNLTQAQIDQIKSGQKPDGLDDASSVAYEVAKELMEKRRPLSDETWKKSETTLGKDGTLTLMNIVGFYTYMSVLMNACDMPVPGEESGDKV